MELQLKFLKEFSKENPKEFLENFLKKSKRDCLINFFKNYLRHRVTNTLNLMQKKLKMAKKFWWNFHRNRWCSQLYFRRNLQRICWGASEVFSNVHAREILDGMVFGETIKGISERIAEWVVKEMLKNSQSKPPKYLLKVFPK